MDALFTTSARDINGFPPTVCIELLRLCNLACPHCRSHSSPHAGRSELTLRAVLRLIDGLARLGKWRVSLTGGEPALWKSTSTLLSELADRATVFSLTTNGTTPSNILLDLPSSVWKSGTLKVSVDGSRRLHDLVRGAGSFDKTIGFVARARPLTNRLCVNTTLVWDATLWADDLFLLLRDRRIDKWSIIAPVERNIWAGLIPSASPTLSYVDQFAYIQGRAAINGGGVPISFLNYASIETKLRDVVYVDADGRVDLPGFLDGSAHPAASSVHISDPDLLEKIAISTDAFEAAGLRLQ